MQAASSWRRQGRSTLRLRREELVDIMRICGNRRAGVFVKRPAAPMRPVAVAGPPGRRGAGKKLGLKARREV